MNHPGSAEDRHITRQALPRHARSLPDKVLVAFYAACDQHNVEVAWRLLVCFETLIGRSAEKAGRRGHLNRESLVTAHERLWQQRHLSLARPKKSQSQPGGTG